MEGVRKCKIVYKIGTEIETIISGRTCEDCSYCAICDDCPICHDCQENHYYCDACDEEIRQRILEYAIEHELINKDEIKNIDDSLLCEICLSSYIWQDVICPDCGRCEDCQYAYNPEYCPYNDYYNINDIDISKIEPYLDNYYYDESCGMEFVTKPFLSLREYWEAVKAIVQTVGKENISVEDKCGGHINISWTNGNKSWKDYEKIIAKNILFFSDLLSYMFCCNETYWRNSYKEFPSYLETLENDIYDKYCAVHIKDYAIEIRIPDSPKDVDNHVLFSAVLLAIAMKTYEIPFDKETFRKTKEIYDKINYYGEKLSKEDKAFLKDKFKLLKKFIEKPLKALSHDLGIDLMKALEHRFKNPKYEEEYEEDFNLEQFAIKPKFKVIVTALVQLPLTAFA